VAIERELDLRLYL